MRGRQWQSRRILGYLDPGIQLENYHIILNNPEIDLKIGRTNPTTKGKEEDTLKKVGSKDMWLQRETDCSCCSGEGGAIVETGKR